MLFIRIFKESFLFAFDALRHNKLRTILSLSGVTIGIFLIISVFTLVDTLEHNVRSSVEKLGNNVIYVQKWPWGGFGDYPWWEYFQRPVSKLSEQQILAERSQTAQASTFISNVGNKTLEFKNNTVDGADVSGVTHSFSDVRDLLFSDGRYFTNMESNSGENVVILGATIAEGLFGSIEPIGKEVRLMGRNVTVIGVLKEEGDDLLGISSDEWVLLPLNYARTLVNIRSESSNPDIWVKGKEGLPVKEVKAEIRGIMRSIRKLQPSEKDNFSLNQMDIVAKQTESMFAQINIIGWIIGGFSILVGCFGIANIMFVSVKERTNIIGIQKSLGAKNYFILNQFLFESVFLCLLGGLLGLLIVALLTFVINSVTEFEVILSVGNIIMGISISIITGIISGFWPAFSAAKLNPVEAIRSGM